MILYIFISTIVRKVLNHFLSFIFNCCSPRKLCSFFHIYLKIGDVVQLKSGGEKMTVKTLVFLMKTNFNVNGF
ncbi:MAG: hypothetical protein COB99_07800 [Sulfurimonas sp.]|nr:MAG: hypothetical protein COB99_07800 [Sulfurimonas sp.]